jgi:mono/diheme cytochrome c family protein
MRFASGFLAAIALLILAALAVSYSGIVNVAATESDNPVSAWFLSTTMQRSVRQQASGIAAPRQASEEEVREGFRFYSKACVYCHGAPGKEPTDIGKGLSPEPPYLPDVAARWSSAELFWIAKNGIRMTGMPAFGSTHKDEEIWKVVAFVQRLPKVSEEEYAKMEHP